MHTDQTVYFIGIGGAGMCGIAHVLLAKGYSVAGSDLEASQVTASLIKLGAKVHIGHNAGNIADADLVVVSSAIADDNAELVAARKQQLPIFGRAEMLAQIMSNYTGIAIAGTHGKTTTTSMMAAVFNAAGLDPTFVIGGKLTSHCAHASLGKGKYFIAEADESDASFLHLQPQIAVITNIDSDHMSTYAQNFTQLTDSFVTFANKLPFDSYAVVCADDPVIKDLQPTINRKVVSYGFTADAHYRATNITNDVNSHSFEVIRPAPHKPLQINLRMLGKHNIANALACVALATQEGLSDKAIQQALAEFGGIERRFDMYPNTSIGNTSVTLIDDYGHHPTEIDAMTATIRQQWPNSRLVMAYQPHRYTRTRDLYLDFIKSLAKVDLLLLLPVYSAGEAEITDANSEKLASDLKKVGVNVSFCASQQDAINCLADKVQNNDIVVIQGAGDIAKLIDVIRQNKVNEHVCTESIA